MIQETQIMLVAGLGNPGAEYAGTRHNAGFDVIARVLEKLPGGFVESHRHESRCFDGRFRGRALTLLLPQTYMNLSGKAVAGAARRRGIAPQEVLVVSDDLDLPVGRLRIRRGGSAGGHHGLESVMQELGDAGFLRLRVGIGRDERGRTVDHVLSAVDAAEQPVYRESLDAAAAAVIAILAGGAARAMNEFNAWRPSVENETKAGGADAAAQPEALR